MAAELRAKVRVNVHEAEEGGYWAEVPALPGCFTQAETTAELRTNIQAAIDLYQDDAVGPAPTAKRRKPRACNRP